jgi:hypothetical protein
VGGGGQGHSSDCATHTHALLSHAHAQRTRTVEHAQLLHARPYQRYPHTDIRCCLPYTCARGWGTRARTFLAGLVASPCPPQTLPPSVAERLTLRRCMQQGSRPVAGRSSRGAEPAPPSQRPSSQPRRGPRTAAAARHRHRARVAGRYAQQPIPPPPSAPPTPTHSSRSSSRSRSPRRGVTRDLEPVEPPDEHGFGEHNRALLAAAHARDSQDPRTAAHQTDHTATAAGPTRQVQQGVDPPVLWHGTRRHPLQYHQQADPSHRPAQLRRLERPSEESGQHEYLPIPVVADGRRVTGHVWRVSQTLGWVVAFATATEELMLKGGVDAQ